MIPERRSVLHSWCVQSDWDAPTVVGGEAAARRVGEIIDELESS
jgi:hypothetical protein